MDLYKKLKTNILFSYIIFSLFPQFATAKTNQKLECSVDSHDVSQDLELTTNGNDISDFWYFEVPSIFRLPTGGFYVACAS